MIAPLSDSERAPVDNRIRDDARELTRSHDDRENERAVFPCTMSRSLLSHAGLGMGPRNH